MILMEGWPPPQEPPHEPGSDMALWLLLGLFACCVLVGLAYFAGVIG